METFFFILCLDGDFYISKEFKVHRNSIAAIQCHYLFIWTTEF